VALFKSPSSGSKGQVTPISSFTFRVAGESGEGVISAGEIATLAISDIGYNVFTFESYPAEIKGGHCWYQVRASNEEVLSAGSAVDVLCAFNQEGIDKHLDMIRPGGVVIYDPGQVKDIPEKPDLAVYPIEFDALVKEKVGSLKAKNVFAVSCFAALYEVPAESVKRTMRKKFAGKNPVLLEKNDLAVDEAYKHIKTLPRQHDETLATGEQDDNRMMINGNQAIVLGALVAGVDLYAGYPITPASSILEALAVEMPKLGKTCVQMEDEMAALSACIGGSYAGKKVMTATSGPGLSLMQELLGLASTAELPVVIVNAQRGGPSTGLPTKPEQSDLNMMVYGSHGEASRIVIAPTGVKDAFFQTIWAFNMAEKYQVPVMIATDHALANRTENIVIPTMKGTPIWNRTLASEEDLVESYRRYKFTEDGVSPMAVPGMAGGMHVAEGLEHNEFGHPTYTGENHTAMIEKRLGKIADAWKYPMAMERFGDENPDVLVVAWGSTKGPVKEAVQHLIADGKKVGYIIPKILCPLPREGFLDVISDAPQVVVVEANFTGQLEGLLRKETTRDYHRLNKVMGSPISWLEIVEKVDAILGGTDQVSERGSEEIEHAGVPN
jgi:2-oxoglutarate ferredoxin oxidoreductase subunit alpha